MIFSKSILLTLVTSLICTGIFAQHIDKQLADSLGREAVKLMDSGDPSASIDLLEQAIKLDPGNYVYEYEIAYAEYLLKKYDAAAKRLERMIKKYDPDPLFWKMLGNCYDLMKKPKKALAAYDEGLKVFPTNGSIYLEKGVVYAKDKDYEGALQAWEKGIQVDPNYPSNYHRAAQLLLSSKERVWSMLYLEYFLNLEFNTDRAEDASELLYRLYNSIYTKQSDTSGAFNITERGMRIVMTEDLLEAMSSPDSTFRLLPFEGEFGLKFSGNASPFYLASDTLSIEDIHNARNAFLLAWAKPGGESLGSSVNLYPDALLNALIEIQKLGYLDLYDYYMFRNGDREEFDAFYYLNESRYGEFFAWFDKFRLDMENYPVARVDH